MSAQDHRERGKLFNEVPALYERVRPLYPDELFTDLIAVTGVYATSSVLEIGCGTGQATRALAQLGGHVTAIEPGAEMATSLANEWPISRTSPSKPPRSKSGTSRTDDSHLWAGLLLGPVPRVGAKARG